MSINSPNSIEEFKIEKKNNPTMYALLDNIEDGKDDNSSISTLLQAIKSYNLDDALELLTSDPPTPKRLNERTSWHQSPLHLAAVCDLERIVEKLLESGVDPKLEDIQGHSAAHLAVREGNYKSAAVLLPEEVGISKNAKRLQKLMECIKEKDEQLALSLLSSQPPTMYQLNRSVGLPPLHLAAAIRNFDKVVKKLINCGSKPQLLDSFGNTAADWAVYRRNYRMAALLLEKGSDLNEENKTYLPLLQVMQGIRDGNEDVVLSLLSSNPPTAAQLNASFRRPPLHYAAGFNQDRVVKKLLDYGADPQLLDTTGWTAADRAVNWGNYILAGMLLKKGSYLNNGNMRIESIQHLLEYVEDDDEKSALAELSAKKPTADQLNIPVPWPPLHLAAFKGQEKVVQKLIDFGAVKDFPNVFGFKAIDWAVRKNHPEVVKILVSLENVDDKLKHRDETPLGYAAIYGFDQIMIELINKGADITQLPCNAKIPLCVVKKCLDDCISFAEENKDEGKMKIKEERKLQFSYHILLGGGSKKQEGKIQQELNDISEAELVSRFCWSMHYGEILPHPLIRMFLFKKWLKIEWAFWIWILLKLSFFLSLLTTAINLGTNKYFLANKSDHFSSHKENASEEFGLNEQISFVKNQDNNLDQKESILSSSAAVFLVIFGITESFQLLTALCRLKMGLPGYFKDSKNSLQWAILILLTILVKNYDLTSWKMTNRHILGALLPLTCLELLHEIGHLPGCAHIIKIFSKVAWTFLIYISFYGFLIISFAVSFFIILPESEDENSYPTYFGKLLVKYVVMFTGEQDFMDIPFPTESNAFELVFFIIFMILVTIVLINILNALAVRDIQEMMKEVEVVMLKQLLGTVLFWDNLLHSMKDYNYVFEKLEMSNRIFATKDKTLTFLPFKENNDKTFVQKILRTQFVRKFEEYFFSSNMVIKNKCIEGALHILSKNEEITEIMNEERDQKIRTIEKEKAIEDKLRQIDDQMKKMYTLITKRDHVSASSQKYPSSPHHERLLDIILNISEELHKKDPEQLNHLLENEDILKENMLELLSKKL